MPFGFLHSPEPRTTELDTLVGQRSSWATGARSPYKALWLGSVAERQPIGPSCARVATPCDSTAIVWWRCYTSFTPLRVPRYDSETRKIENWILNSEFSVQYSFWSIYKYWLLHFCILFSIFVNLEIGITLHLLIRVLSAVCNSLCWMFLKCMPPCAA